MAPSPRPHPHPSIRFSRYGRQGVAPAPRRASGGIGEGSEAGRMDTTTWTVTRLSGRSVRLGWVLAATTFVGVIAVPGCSAFNFRRSAPATVAQSPEADGWRSTADATAPAGQAPSDGQPDD